MKHLTSILLFYICLLLKDNPFAILTAIEIALVHYRHIGLKNLLVLQKFRLQAIQRNLLLCICIKVFLCDNATIIVILLLSEKEWSVKKIQSLVFFVKSTLNSRNFLFLFILVQQ